MSSRERVLAILLIVAMTGAAGGFMGYQLVYKKYTQNVDKLAKLKDEVDTLEAKKDVIELEQHIYETKTRKMSLPTDGTPNQTVAQREYERLIDRMLRQTKFASPEITPLAPDSKTKVPILAGKKPAYTKLNFVVRVKGDLVDLVDFMYAFYRQPLLQQIQSIEITKPMRSRGDGPETRELDIKLTIQALVLDRAEERRILLAPLPQVIGVSGGAAATSFSMQNVESGLGTPIATPGVLARGQDAYDRTSANSEYRRIAGKNIFFDPIVSTKKEKDTGVKEKEQDLAPFLRLTRVSHSDGKSSALIWDKLRNQDYEIEMNNRGDVKVTRYFYKRTEEENGAVATVREKSSEKPYLQFGGDEGFGVHLYSVRRIMENELLLEPLDAERDNLLKGPASLVFGGSAVSVLPGKLYAWSIGQALGVDHVHDVMKEVVADKSIAGSTDDSERRHALLRPLDVDNEGDATITFTGSGANPPDFKMPLKKGAFDPSKGSSKKRPRPGGNQ